MLFRWALQGTLHWAVLLVSLSHAKQYSWCDPELCGAGVTHLACKNNANFHKRCPSDAVELDISKYKSSFVHEHNKRRNFVALGLLPGYYPAAQMATMVWDDELQYLASLNLRTCILDHDDCHTTYRFKNSGQNLVALVRPRTSKVNVTSLIEEAMIGWFNEFDLIDSSYIDSFKVTKHFEDYGHFAEMVVDRNTHVGCGIVRFTRPEYAFAHIYHVTCNYASIYALETPVYAIGHPASKCVTGSNHFYPGLCTTREEIDPNY